VQSTRTTARRRTRAVLALSAALIAAATGLLAPAPAAADPTNAAQARALVEEAAQQLTAIDEQVHEAELIVAAQQATAADAAAQAAVAQEALAVYTPRIRAIAQSAFTAENQSRVAAFLTSDSADELVQQMTTLDLIADHTNSVIVEVAAAQTAAQQAQAAADQAAANAQAGLDQL
jgi:peptidoglycan DL-endopeptidase CwlO